MTERALRVEASVAVDILAGIEQKDDRSLGLWLRERREWRFLREAVRLCSPDFASLWCTPFMSTHRLGEDKALTLIRTADGGAKYVDAPLQEAVDEDTYNDSISSILDRDFFPELPKLRAYNEWLEARQNGDFERMAQVRAEWRQSGTWTRSHCTAFPILQAPLHAPVLTPLHPYTEQKKRSFSSLDTPDVISRGMAGATPDLVSKRRKLADASDSQTHEGADNQLTRDAKTLSLDAFLTKYMSEDDASFSQLLERQVTAARRAYKLAFESATEEREKMMTEGKLIGWKGKAHDSAHAGVLTYPSGIPRTFTSDEFKGGDKTVISENTRFPNGGPYWKSEEMQSSSSAAGTANSSAQAAVSESNLDTEMYARILRGRRSFEDGTADFDNADDNGNYINGYRILATPQRPLSDINGTSLVAWRELGDDDGSNDFGLPVASSTTRLHDESSAGFSVPRVSHRMNVTNKLIKKRAPPSAVGQSPLLARAAAMKTPSVQMTPDLQLRSSYASTPKLAHGRTPSGLRSGQTTPSRTPARK